MDFDKFTSNSQIVKKTIVPKPSEVTKSSTNKVVTNKVRIAKPSLTDRITKEIKGDDERKVGKYLMDTVFIPRAKDLLSDTLQHIGNTFMDVIDTSLFGAPRPRNYNGSRVNGSKVYNYNRVSERDRRTAPTYQKLYFSTRDEANNVLNAMLDRIDNFQAVSVAHLYEMIGETSGYQDRKIGWERLSTAEVRKEGREYLLDLPTPKQIS